MDSLDAVIEAKIGGAFQGDTGRLVAQEIANAVRAYLESSDGALADQIADTVEGRISTEFKGFWTREDLLEEIPGMIREAARAALQAAGGKGDGR